MNKYKNNEEVAKTPLEVTPEVEHYCNFAYLRDRNRHRRGVLLAYAPPDAEDVLFSMSLCMPEDAFDPQRGLEIAKEKLANGDSVKVDLGDLRYALTAAGVRDNNGANQLLGEMKSMEFISLFEAIINETGATQEGWHSLGIDLVDHATTLANVVKWAMKGDALPWT